MTWSVGRNSSEVLFAGRRIVPKERTLNLQSPIAAQRSRQRSENGQQENRRYVQVLVYLESSKSQSIVIIFHDQKHT